MASSRNRRGRSQETGRPTSSGQSEAIVPSADTRLSELSGDAGHPGATRLPADVGHPANTADSRHVGPVRHPSRGGFYGRLPLHVRLGIILRGMWGRPGGRFALIVMALWLVVSAVSLVWTPYPLLHTDGDDAWASPSAAHPLGTDGVGADVLSWLMAGSRTDLAVAVLTVLVSAAIGLALTAAMVSTRRMLASASVVVVDALIAIPTVLLALLFAVPFGTSIAVVVAACGITYGLNMARILRPTAALAVRSAYVEAARASGVGPWRVFVRHIVPSTFPVLAVQLSMSAGTSILAEAGLTYLGVGVPSGVPSWGHSLTTSVRLISVYPLTVLWPGLVVTLVVTALYLLGDAIRDCADPLANPELRRVEVGCSGPADRGEEAES